MVEKAAPLGFFAWAPGEPLERGSFGIEVPRERRAVVPDVLVIPMLGFDRERYRLGYGGGYFDRTLAAANPRPLSIGVSFACGLVESIDPEPHDQRMDFVVTDEALWPARTDRVSPGESPPSPE